MSLPPAVRTPGLIAASCMTLECGRPVPNNRPATPDAQTRSPRRDVLETMNVADVIGAKIRERLTLTVDARLSAEGR